MMPSRKKKTTQPRPLFSHLASSDLLSSALVPHLPWQCLQQLGAACNPHSCLAMLYLSYARLHFSSQLQNLAASRSVSSCKMFRNGLQTKLNRSGPSTANMTHGMCYIATCQLRQKPTFGIVVVIFCFLHMPQGSLQLFVAHCLLGLSSQTQ